MDHATGLLYVGNGQYYDPETGRFLTRNPNASGNPYLPFDPTGALFVPLAFASLLYGKKKKKSKLDVLIIIALLSLSAGLGVAACKPGDQVTATITPVVTPTGTPSLEINATTSSGDRYTATITGTPNLIPTVIPDCATPSTQIPTPIDTVLESYGVKLIGDMTGWTSPRITAVRDAVINVAAKMAQVAGGGRSPTEVFRLVYEGINISWGFTNASGTCLSIGTGGCTSGPHDINFVKLSDESLRARNNVVHELGHAFSKFWNETQPNENQIAYSRQHPEVVNPVIVLAWAHEYPGYTEHYIPDFRYRNTPPLGDTSLGNYYGFGSQQNDTSWQVAVTNAGTASEEFADQFLGWTFDYWERTRDGSFSYEATMRRNFMEKYMGGWIRYRIEN